MSYRDVRKELAEKMGTVAACNRCSEPGQWQVLSDHAGMCYPCYRVYCSADQPATHGNYGIAPAPLAWAHRLRAREAAGERLGRPQSDAWREVLGQPMEMKP